MYFDVPHGSSPEIGRYQLDGTFPRSGQDFSLSLQSRGNHWELLFARPDLEPVRLRLGADRLRDIRLDRVLIWARYDEQLIYIRIPYGEPHENCFANGDDVFSSLHIAIGTATPIVSETSFPACQPTHTELSLQRRGDHFLISN